MHSAKQGNDFKMFHWNGKLSFCLHVSCLLAQYSRCLAFHLNQNGAILFRKGFDCKIIEKIIDPSGRYISIQAQINDENYFLVNVYGPNNDNQAVQLIF